MIEVLYISLDIVVCWKGKVIKVIGVGKKYLVVYINFL